MIRILCEETDLAAFWAAERLASRGLPVETITGLDLTRAERWEHRVGKAGASFALALPGGRILASDQPGGVLNRLSFLPAAWMRQNGGPDRDYAIQEMHALYLSWLSTLAGPVLNPPTPQGLCGNWRHPSAWAALAGRAGLPVPIYRQSSADDSSLAWQPVLAPGTVTVLVVGARIVAPPFLPDTLHEPCRRLSLAAGAPLLGIDFLPDEAGAWQFSTASIIPDLIQGGEPLVDALAAALS